MKKQNVLAKANKLLAQKRILIIALSVLLPLNFLLAIAVVSLIGTERIVLVPPSIKQSLWIEKNQASVEVLEQWGGYFVSLLLNVTSESFSARSDTLLSYVDPEHYGKIKAMIDKQNDALSKRAISTYFSLVKLQGFEADQTVVLHGNLKMLHGNTVYRTIPKTFRLKLALKNGKPTIKHFEEISHP